MRRGVLFAALALLAILLCGTALANTVTKDGYTVTMTPDRTTAEAWEEYTFTVTITGGQPDDYYEYHMCEISRTGDFGYTMPAYGSLLTYKDSVTDSAGSATEFAYLEVKIVGQDGSSHYFESESIRIVYHGSSIDNITMDNRTVPAGGTFTFHITISGIPEGDERELIYEVESLAENHDGSGYASGDNYSGKVMVSNGENILKLDAPDYASYMYIHFGLTGGKGESDYWADISDFGAVPHTTGQRLNIPSFEFNAPTTFVAKQPFQATITLNGGTPPYKVVIDTSIFSLSGKWVHVPFEFSNLPAGTSQLTMVFDEPGRGEGYIRITDATGVVMDNRSSRGSWYNELEGPILANTYAAHDPADLNGDGGVGLDDALTLLQAVTGGAKLDADLNEDGVTDILDVVALLRWLCY